MSIGIGPETESLFMQRVASNDELAFAQTAWPSIEWTTEMDAGLVACEEIIAFLSLTMLTIIVFIQNVSLPLHKYTEQK